MNAVEKIIAAHSTRTTVRPGQIVDVDLDAVMVNDATATLANSGSLYGGGELLGKK